MKQLRIMHFNQWPATQEFKAEAEFKSRLDNFEVGELFFPYQLPNSRDKNLHICVSYFLDAVDSLPLRPDHAFDWAWRGFEFLSERIQSKKENITDRLRSTVVPAIESLFASDKTAESSFFSFASEIPFQTCEYLLKRISEGAPYTFSPGPKLQISSYAKRLLLSNGNPPVVSSQLQEVLVYLSTRYDCSDSNERRNGASLIRRLIRLESVTLGSNSIQLSRSDVLFFLISGLGYAFRNDRAHAKSIAPFRSSYASLKTYAHCWFLFLLLYKVTLLLLHTPNSPVVLSGSPSDNFYKNTRAFSALFGSHLGA